MHEVSRLRCFSIAILLSIHQFDVMKKFDIQAGNSVLGPLRLRPTKKNDFMSSLNIQRTGNSYIIYLLTKILKILISYIIIPIIHYKQPSTKYSAKLSPAARRN